MAVQENTIKDINPHDKLIQEILDIQNNAHSFLTSYLSEKVLGLLDRLVKIKKVIKTAKDSADILALT